MYQLFVWAGIIVDSVYQIFVNHAPIVDTLLEDVLFAAVGCVSLVGWFLHLFYSEKMSKYIGWETNGFHKEVAYANLGIGTLGLLCYFIQGTFWLATGIAASIFLLGCGITHIQDIKVNRNHQPGNSGFHLVLNCFFTPLSIITLLIAHYI